MRVIAASILYVATAFRTNIHKHETQTKFGATCENLQETFSARLSSIQETVNAIDAEDPQLSRGQQAMLTMRMYGIGRTMRRAKDCDWMQASEGVDSENAQKARGLVTTLMRVNPCAETARAEMASLPEDAGEEQRAVAMQRAMSIMTSETCEATEVQDTVQEMVELNDNHEEVSDDDIAASEDMVQQNIEEMVEATDGEGSSFVESKYAVERMLRFLVALAIFLFLVVLCTWVVVWVALFIIQWFTLLLGMIGVYVTGILWQQLLLPPAMLACGYDLFFRILDPEIGRLTR
jgi:hypothetical protein